MADESASSTTARSRQLPYHSFVFLNTRLAQLTIIPVIPYLLIV